MSEGQRVSIEALGLARDFVRRVKREADVWETTIAQLWAPIQARIEKHPDRKLRPELLPTLTRRWQRDMPLTFRLSFQPTIKGVRGTVRETRLAPFEMWENDPDWQGKETGVAIATREVVVDHLSARLPPPTLHAYFSLHALARRIERGARRDDEALIHEMADILRHDLHTKPEGFGFITRFEHADDSGWRGYVDFLEVKNPPGPPQKLAFVRTWV